MKAAVVEHRGQSGSIKEIPAPGPGPSDVLVRVVAAGVNPIDWKRRDRPDTPLPLVLGQDFAGVVSEVGDRVAKYRIGERVFGIARKHGTYAEFTLLSEDDSAEPLAKIPDDVGDADAAALPTAGITALGAIETLDVSKGTSFLVLGATGGVGSYAVQIARDRGARIIGSARSANESLARSLGVDEFIAYDKEDASERLRGGEIEAVLDLVDDSGGIKRIAGVMRDGGRIVSTIGAADVDWFAARNIVATNLYAADTPQWSHAGLRSLLELVEQGAIRVMIAGERPLAEAVDALEESKSGSVDGKIVIIVD
ncbi:MAG: NADP-dependent oxidoreductase [Candidatus Eremiobacteraeota bacterium]|nr:NADP-dependent oxidoreductase [Candidatus Eremiobacteraeota bacterium]MBV9263310.1 NADP-dependent oxidoreductase [Candidatus Eremiobacteraeota bacterium]